MDYDADLHAAWVATALALALEYREADAGGEVRDAFRALKGHLEGQPASMAHDMDAVASQFAHRMAMHLECVLLDYPASGRFYNESLQTLGDYRSAMNALHDRVCPTHMGEPVTRIERK